MPDTDINDKLSYYAELLIRYHWYVIVAFCIAVTCGIIAILTLPAVYSAQTLILVQPQKVPTDFVRNIVSSDIESRINTISQQIMSRTNIEKIINEFNLLSGQENESLFLEDKLAMIRKRITIDVSRPANPRESASSFSVAFQGKDPKKVRDVTNALATYFIDENLKVREAQAIGTSDFLESERNTMQEKLVEVEMTLRDYRAQYMGELPEQLQSNLAILNQMEQQQLLRQERLMSAKNRLAVLKSQSMTPAALPDAVIDDAALDSHVESNNAAQAAQNLFQLERQLSALQTRYTDRHPDILRIKNLIAQLKDEGNAGQNQSPQSGQSQEPDAPPAGQAINGSANAQIDAVRLEISGLETDIAASQEQIAVYQKRIENTPKREQELMSLQRDYENILESYNSLLSRKLEAEIAVNMEKKQKGEQFRIIDSAKIPEKPISPNRKQIFLMTIAVGLGIGCGFAFARDFLDSSFKTKEEVETLLGMPVLAAIPTLAQPNSAKIERFKRVLSICGIVFSACLLSLFAAIVFVGMDQIAALIQKVDMFTGIKLSEFLPG